MQVRLMRWMTFVWNSLSLPTVRVDTAHHISLASFGGAGGQHACEIARQLNIKKILIHRYSSILSAYGLALADRYALLSLVCPFLAQTKLSLARSSNKSPARRFTLLPPGKGSLPA